MNITFSRRTDLALAAMQALSQADRRVSGRDLAGQIGTSTTFLPQVMSPLLQAGWVASERGPGGGYQLMPAADDVSLLQVVEATEGPTANGRCVLREGPCPGNESCAVHEIWVEARRVLVDGFDLVPALESKGDRT